MSINPEQFAAANKAAVDSLLSVANTALASAERIANLNFETVRSVVDESIANTKALMDAKDPKEALSIQTSLAKPSLEKAVAYSRSMVEISTQTQQELTKMLESQFGDFQKNITGLLEKLPSRHRLVPTLPFLLSRAQSPLPAVLLMACVKPPSK